jgi:hypothetical protein
MKYKLTSGIAAAMTLGSIITVSAPSSAADLLLPGTYGYPDAYQYACFTSDGSSLTLSGACGGEAERYWLYPVPRHAQPSQPYSSKVSWTANNPNSLINNAYACGRVWTYNSDGTNIGPTAEQCATGASGVGAITYSVTGGGQVILVMRMRKDTLGLGTSMRVTRVWSDGF